MPSIPDRKRVLVDRDKMNMASQEAVAHGTVSVFNALQRLPKHIQLLSLAAAFVLMSEASGIPAQDTATAVSNLMVDPNTSERRSPQFQAMKYHLSTEVLA